jgi:putative transposase
VSFIGGSFRVKHLDLSIGAGGTATFKFQQRAGRRHETSERRDDAERIGTSSRTVTARYPHHVWGTDLTCIRMTGGWRYLVAFLDGHSRYIVSWELDQTMAVERVVRALERALAQARPAICNSDQGSQYTSPAYTARLTAAGVAIRMAGKGQARDNVFTERLWRTLKYEEVYLHEYDSPRAAREHLTRYIQFYNEERVHQALDYRTPASVDRPPASTPGN